ncbi:MAG: ABC transporter permease [Rhizobiales bacterium]|nr:ABC transporter permease [Hyphomicrobiales bacterium]
MTGEQSGAGQRNRAFETESGVGGLALFLVITLIALAFAVAMAAAIGDYNIELRTVVLSVTNGLGLSNADIPPIEQSVVWDLRLSRALIAALAGAGLAISGAILQALLRNALAEPFVLGISAGASTGAVSVIVLGIGAGAVSLSFGAFAGAFAAFAVVAALSNGATSGPNHTILAGVAASQLFNALTSYIVTTSGNAQQARDVMFWLLGSFGGVRWPDFQVLVVVVFVGLGACLLMARSLDAFTFGDEDAAALGVPVARLRLILFGITAMMTATIVSMVGTIGFVGLVVPHAARYIVGPLHMRLLPASAAVGAVFLVIADIVSRVLVTQQTIPIGVVTALVGVPFFALILYRSRPQT